MGVMITYKHKEDNMKVILHEDDCNEEWWQPELHCEKCGCTFMWSSYPNFSEYPTFCPNCGEKFTGLRKGKELIF